MCSIGEPCYLFESFAEESEAEIFSNSVVLFLPGTHEMNINLRLENLTNVEFNVYLPSLETLVLLGPLANITWIECENITINNLDFIFIGGDDPELFLSALFFRDCEDVLLSGIAFKGESNSTYSIALRGHTSTITVINSRFSDCSHSFGGGVTTYLCDISIKNSLFENNTAQTSGGAIFTYSGVLTLSDNVFTNNSAQISGGAVYCKNCTVLVNDKNTFQYNYVIIDGGAISCDNAVIVINGESHFVGNRAEYLGGAISVFKDTLLNITANATFCKNFAGWAGGALLLFGSKGEVRGKVIINTNTANVAGGGGIAITHNSSFFWNRCLLIKQHSSPSNRVWRCN